MQNEVESKQDPTWRWLWERLLLPLSDKKDAGIVWDKPHLRLVKTEDEIDKES